MEYIQESLFGRMSPVPSVATKEKIFEPSLKNLRGLKMKPLQFLNLSKTNGTLAGASWEMVTVLHGVSWMLNTGEFPNAAVESSLSQILEDNPHPKYYLSAKACQGILRRAEKRGKELPKVLKEALLRRSCTTTIPTTAECQVLKKSAPQFQADGEPGGGNTPLVKEAYIIGNGQADQLYLKDVSGALNCMHDQQAIITAGFCPEEGAKTRGIGYAEEQSPTLRAGVVPGVVAGFNGHKSITGNICYNEERSPSLETKMPPNCICLQGSMIGRADENGPQGNGINEDVSFTLNTIDRHAVAYGMDLSQKAEGIGFKEEQAACLAPGTHGGAGMNVMCADIAKCLKASAGSIDREDAHTLIVSPTLDTRYNEKFGCNQFVDQWGEFMAQYAVRRLTPLECERLQGFPDNFTNIPKASDSARYKALGNSVAIPCVEYIAEGIAEILPGAIGGSLFDGIGGFPLAFSRYGIVFVWASEIDKFCVAVTTARFGGEPQFLT